MAAKKPQQLNLLKVAVAKEINGLEMGVLSDGTAYFTGRGLARLCGLASSSIVEHANNWKNGKRDGKLAQWLLSHGIERETLYIETEVAGTKVTAYPDDVCMLILEYYAFEVGRPAENLQERYRALARAGLRIFVYSALGYDPTKLVPPVWRKLHDRLLLVTSPVGYFGIFMETAGFVLNAIRGGLSVDEHTIPDISVGLAWGKHWKDNNLEAVHGARIQHEHNYPDDYPQAASNPQHPWVYPVSAIGEFRIWLQREYVMKKFPKYLEGKVEKGVLPPSVAQLLIEQAAPVEPQLTE